MLYKEPHKIDRFHKARKVSSICIAGLSYRHYKYEVKHVYLYIKPNALWTLKFKNIL